jgi:hypothetical protein
MTHTITNVRQGVPGDRRYVIKTIDCTSYPTGGIPLLAGDIGLSNIDFIYAWAKENPQYDAVYKDTGVPRMVFTMTITTAATGAGTVAYTIDGVAVNTAMAGDTTDDTVGECGAKIRAALNASAWVTSKFGVSGTAGSVILTARDSKSGHTATIGFGTSGCLSSGGVVTTQDKLFVYTLTANPAAETSNATDIGEVKILAYGTPGGQ